MIVFYHRTAATAHVFLCGLALYNDLSNMETYFWLYTLYIIFASICEILRVASFVGFSKWKRYSWYCFMALLGVNTGFILICMIIMLSYAPGEAGTTIGQLIGFLIYAIPTAIYYKKRKRLFFDTYIQMKTAM